ncbi:hypothetical protein ACQY0O_004015 [Thecaphora frezii]
MSAPEPSEVPTIPQRPAGTAYHPKEFQDEQEEIQRLASTFFQRYGQRLQDQGVVDGVQGYLVAKPPDEPLSELPAMAGRGHVEGLTPLEVFAAIRVTRYRMLWDVRIQSANIVRAFSMHEFSFYIVWRGIGPIYSPRDCIGVQTARFYDAAGHQQPHPDFTTRRVVLGYFSVPRLPGIPDQCEGCVRARIIEGGYVIDATDTGCDVTYFAKADLGITIPGWILRHLVGETRHCVARLRDALRTFGVPPIVVDKQQCVALHYLDGNPETRSIMLLATIIRAGTFGIYLDHDKMYTQGVVVTSIQGPAAPFLRIRDEVTSEDGLARRRIAIDTMDPGAGGDFQITFEATDKSGPDSGSGPGWW